MSVGFEHLHSACNRLALTSSYSRFRGSLAALLFLISINAPQVLAADSGQNDIYSDDTHEVLTSGIDVTIVSGDFGYETYQLKQKAGDKPLALDARKASFIVANSRNLNPTSEADCETGGLLTNRYPLKIYSSGMTSVVGGIINGEIPQESDWKPTYCNSAAVIFKDSPDSAVDGMRITSAWDGIRPDRGSSNLTIRNSWISNVRDDAVENDAFLSLVVEDNLIDGAFQGISIHSGGDIRRQSRETIFVYGNVIKIREYLYKGRQQYGALFKNEDSSPQSVIHNTVLAVDYKGGRTFSGYWKKSWSKIKDCSNNLFLWLSDEPMPDSVPLPPACFTVLTGAEARTAWDRARQNWIDCHPRVARTPTDPASNPEQCAANSFGGYSQHTYD